MYKNLSYIVLAASISWLAGCDSMTTPEVVNFEKLALYPEGVDWDANRKRFLVTSIRQGIVSEVKDDGAYKIFAMDPRMVSAVGIRIDAKRDRVLVCNADPGASKYSSKKTTGKLAALAVFQLSTGKLTNYIDLAKGLEGGHFCNDIAIDKDGTAYITDSFSTIIYKVDTAYNASVFLNSKRFGGKGFNLNGIVVKDNYLLVDKMNDGSLFKVPLKNPKAFTEVKIQEPLLGADGLLWGPDGTLVVVVNDSIHRLMTTGGPVNDRTVKLTSSDGWASASIAKSSGIGEVSATTGVVRNGEVYVVYSMLHVLFNPKTTQHTEVFGIHKQSL